MDTTLYRRNVLKTLQPKAVKLGLKTLARSTNQTLIAQATDGLVRGTHCLMNTMQPYLLGEQLTHSMREQAREDLGDIAYHLVVLAKYLKVKLPGAGKKQQLQGTLGVALLSLLWGAGVLHSIKGNCYGAPALKEVKSEATGKVHATVDLPAQVARNAEDNATMAEALERFIDLYWRFTFALLHDTPALVFQGSIAKLALLYPDGTFDLTHPEKPAAAAPAPEPAPTPAPAAPAAKAKKAPAKKKPATTA